MQAVASPLGHSTRDRKVLRNAISVHRADDGIRTRDPNLGKVVRYQLRYVRMVLPAVFAFGYPLAAYNGTERKLYPMGSAQAKPGQADSLRDAASEASNSAHALSTLSLSWANEPLLSTTTVASARRSSSVA